MTMDDQLAMRYIKQLRRAKVKTEYRVGILDSLQERGTGDISSIDN
jgi:hypothetical protein